MEEHKEEIKTCATCAHLIGVRRNTEDADRWKCGNDKNKSKINLVSGLQEYKYSPAEQRAMPLEHHNDVKYCSGRGNWYEKYIHPSEVEAPEWTATDLDSIGASAADRIAKLKKPKLGNLDNLKL